VNGGWDTRVIGSVSPCTVYNGGNSGITCPIASMLDGFPGLTIEAWMASNNVAAQRPLVSKYSGNRRSYWLGIQSNHTAQLHVYDDVTGQASSVGSAPLANNVWTHVAGTWSPEGMSMYINGVLVSRVGTTTTRMQHTTGAVEIGMDTSINSRFNGFIDEVRIWGYPRTEAEILANMSVGQNGAIALLSDGTALAIPAVNLASGLITLGSPVGANRRVTALYTNRHKVVFGDDGDVLLNQENFARKLFSSEGITLMEHVP
jgi:hypothetical protein